MRQQRGGKRDNAGRRAIADADLKRTHSVQMSDDQHAKAVRIGCGNLSRGVQIAVETYQRKVTV